MANFAAVVLEHHIKVDKTARVKIRVSHNGKTKYIDAGFIVTTDNLKIPKSSKQKGNRTLTLKPNVTSSNSIIESVNDIIKGYRKKINEDPLLVKELNIDELINLLTSDNKQYVNLDFLQFGRAHASKLIAEGRERTAQDYITAVNALRRFITRNQTGLGDSLNVNDINASFLESFAEWLVHHPFNENSKVKMSRAPSHYLASIRALHNEMKRKFNDEDRGIVLIPYSPFLKFKIPPRQVTRKRAITPEQLIKIVELPYEPVTNSKGTSRYNLAKDCLMLSFCMIGINSADLYDCKQISSTHITYKRKKTRTRRMDEAEISIQIQPEIKELIKKYRDPSHTRVFNFYQFYSTESNFNKAINKGLKIIGDQVGIKDLEYYAARHSWATIAVNDCGIDKYTVHEALNHVDETMKVTDIYIRKSFDRINQANRTVLNYVFKNIR